MGRCGGINPNKGLWLVMYMSVTRECHLLLSSTMAAIRWRRMHRGGGGCLILRFLSRQKQLPSMYTGGNYLKHLTGKLYFLKLSVYMDNTWTGKALLWGIIKTCVWWTPKPCWHRAESWGQYWGDSINSKEHVGPAHTTSKCLSLRSSISPGSYVSRLGLIFRLTGSQSTRWYCQQVERRSGCRYMMEIQWAW